MFKSIPEQMYELTSRKNADYANAEDAFANFTLIERLTAKETSTEEGFVVRLGDKLQRIGNLIHRPAQVLDEKLEDTLLDLAVYPILFLCYLKSKQLPPN